jgi:hypothetical protein
LVLDGNIGTFFDSPTNTAWVGIDLGPNVAQAICKIRYAPRSGYANRMNGGVFQGANLPDFSDAVALFTIMNTPPDGAMTAQYPANLSTFRYLRYLAPVNGYGNISELEFYSLGPHNNLQSGAIIGTSGSWNNGGNTKEKAMDGDITTFFDGPTGDGNWVGLDLGTAQQSANLRFFPRLGNASRMNGGTFQAANVADFSVATTLLTLTNTPTDSVFTAQVITNPTAFRYVRYLSPNGGYGNVAEVQFYGAGAGVPFTPSAPTGLSASAGDKQIQLAFNASAGATNYHIKRAQISGGPYALITSSTAVHLMDSGLSPGTYYYVVSAVGAGGESANSAEANATIVCPVSVAPASLTATAQPGELIPSWSAVTGATGYNLLRATNSAGPYSILAAAVNATSFIDNSVTASATYFYEVQTLNSCGTSTNSLPVGITALPLPRLSVNISSGQLVLSWPTWAGEYSAASAPNLTPPILWQPVNALPQSSNGILYLSLPITNGPQQYFRLSAP